MKSKIEDANDRKKATFINMFKFSSTYKQNFVLFLNDWKHEKIFRKFE